jgi:AbrB family looped-hinge helix DNA binding protein
MLATVSKKGHVVIPREIREKLNIQPGCVMILEVEEGKLVLRAQAVSPAVSPIDELYGVFADKNAEGSALDILEADHAAEIARDNRP